MIQTIRLQDIYGPDLFSRAKATQLVNYMDVDAESFVLDFTGINFMSRSFTDELYSIDADTGKSFKYNGCNDVIAAMMQKVADGRSRERQLGIQHPQMLTFETKDKLAEFLVTQ